MNQCYLNSPSVGCAMSAEEFAAQSGAPGMGGAPGNGCCGPQPPAGGNGCQPPQSGGQGSGCCCCPQPPAGGNGCQPPQSGGQEGCCCCCCQGAGGAGFGGFNAVNAALGLPLGPGPAVGGGFGQTGSGACQPMICCCQPVNPCPAPPPQVDEGCCCKRSFQAALQLLCDPTIASLLDFDAAAFVTRSYFAGATPAAITVGAEADDNLGTTLTGSLRRLAPCNGDLLEITGGLTVIGGTAATPIIAATEVSLCQLVGIAISLAEAEAVGDITADAIEAQNFRLLQQLLAQRLPSSGGPCGQSCQCCCPDTGDCCCSNGLLCALAQNNLSRRVSLVAGPLQLNGVTLIGSIGNVLVLSNDEDNRIYFVCVNEVEYLF